MIVKEAKTQIVFSLRFHRQVVQFNAHVIYYYGRHRNQYANICKAQLNDHFITSNTTPPLSSQSDRTDFPPATYKPHSARI